MSQDVQIPGDLMDMEGWEIKQKYFYASVLKSKSSSLFEFDDELGFTKMNHT